MVLFCCLLSRLFSDLSVATGRLIRAHFFATFRNEAQRAFDLVVDTATCGQCWQRSFVARRAAMCDPPCLVLGKVDVSLAAPHIAKSQLISEVIDYEDLSKLLGISAAQLGFHLHKDKKFFKYKYFEIAKKSGGTRKISVPEKNLMTMQRHLARHLSELRGFHRCVTGFVSGRSIRDNAEAHVGQKTILNIDISDFFGSINFGRVYGMLSKKPFNIPSGIAAAIAKAATHENKLPQGAPTSPVLSNLICSKLDSQLRSLARKHNCNYSRYADDITFSTHRSKFSLAHLEIGDGANSGVVLNEDLLHIIESNGFKLNLEKTRLFQKIHRQEVTGLIVNQRLNVKRKYIRNIRGALHAWGKFGISEAQRNLTEKFGIETNLDDYLLGQISFVGQIRGKSDQVFRKLVTEFNKLRPRVKIQIKLTSREIAEQATWVIEDADTDSQGTAFFARDIGIVSCSHCVNEKPFIYHRNKPEQQFPLKLKRRDTQRDLAVFETPSSLEEIIPMELSAGIVALDVTPNLTLLGYPNHNKFMPIRVESGNQIRQFNRHGVGYIEISPRIREGNSGGPVVDSNFKVIGIAGKGANHDTSEAVAEYIAINANELLQMVS